MPDSKDLKAFPVHTAKISKNICRRKFWEEKLIPPDFKSAASWIVFSKIMKQTNANKY